MDITPNIGESSSSLIPSAPQQNLAPEALSFSQDVTPNISESSSNLMPSTLSSSHEQELAPEVSKTKFCNTCFGTDHERTSSSKCMFYTPSKKQRYMTFEETSVIKSNLENVCSSPAFVEKLRDVVHYITRIVYTGALFANYHLLYQLEKGIEPSQVSQSLYYYLFSMAMDQGKGASKELKTCFQDFQKRVQLETKKFKNEGFQTIVSSMARKYETLVKNNVVANYRKRTIRYFLNQLSKPSSEFFCGTIATVKQRVSLANHIFSVRICSKSPWPSTVPKSDKTQSIVKNMLKHWNIFDSTNMKAPTKENLFAFPQLFFKWLHNIQKHMEEQQFIKENTPARKVTVPFVYRSLKEIPTINDMPKKSFRSLQEAVLLAVNGNKPLIMGKKVKRCGLKKNVELQVQGFVTDCQDKLKKNAFSPFKYTDPRGSRMFALLPLFDLQCKTVPIDAQSFWKIATSIDKSTISKCKKSEDDLTNWYWQYFHFSKIGFKTKEELFSDTKRFWNLIETNGYSIQFIFKKARKGTSNVKPISPKDLKGIVKNGALIWGVDPGISSLFTAVDASDETTERIRTTSLSEYYHVCNYNKDFWYAKLRFKSYVQKQKGVHEIAKRLLYGSQKYSMNSKVGIKTSLKVTQKHKPASPSDEQRPAANTIVAFGNGCFGSTYRGELSAPTKLIKRATKSLISKDKQVVYIEIDEYLTSQVCFKCQKRSLDK